jgi:methionyl-tRNA synthetase
MIIKEQQQDIIKSEIKTNLDITREITIEDFLKIDLRVAKVIEADNVEGSKKMIRLKLNLGSEEREVFSGIKLSYDPKTLINKYVVMVANLVPRKMSFGVSHGMILAAGGEGKDLYIIEPHQGAIEGLRVG